MRCVPKPSEKTVTRSFRISEAAFKVLEADAASHNVSLNTFVNHLFLSYANSDRFFEKLGMLKMSKPTFIRLLKAIPDEELEKAVRLAGEDSARTIILAKHGTLSLTTVLDYLRMMSEYLYFLEYNETESPEGKRVITLMQSYGKKGSIFVSGFVGSLFEQINIRPKITSSEHSVAFEITSE